MSLTQEELTDHQKNKGRKLGCGRKKRQRHSKNVKGM